MPAVSERALIMLAAPEASFDHDGINPQRIIDNCADGFFWMLTNHRHALRGSNVIAGVPVFLFARGNVKIFFDNLLSPR